MTTIENGNVKTNVQNVETDVQNVETDVQNVETDVQNVDDVHTFELANKSTKDYTLDTMNTPHLNLTANNLLTAMKVLDRNKEKYDYTKAVIMTTLIDSCKTNKDIAKMKKLLVEEYGYSSTTSIDKIYRAVSSFVTVKSKNLLSLRKTDDKTETDLSVTDENATNNYTMIVNNSCIDVLKDKYGFPFSLSALQEMIWLKDENGEIDVDKIIELINNEKLLASMPTSSKTKMSIRSVIDENRIDKPENNNNNGNGNGNENGNGNGNDNDNETTKSIEYDETSDKSKAVAIQTIMNSITSETFVNSDFVKGFSKFIEQFIANQK